MTKQTQSKGKDLNNIVKISKSCLDSYNELENIMNDYKMINQIPVKKLTYIRKLLYKNYFETASK